jgi:hypothetical protein
MIKHFFILFVVVLLVSTGMAQDSIPGLYRQLAVSRTDTGKVRIMLSIANGLVVGPGEDTTDLNKAIALAEKALSMAQQLKDDAWKGRSYLVLSGAYREHRWNDKGILAARNAIALLSKAKCYEECGDAYMMLGDNYDLWNTNEGPLKISSYKEAAGLCKKDDGRLYRGVG